MSGYSSTLALIAKHCAGRPFRFEDYPSDQLRNRLGLFARYWAMLWAGSYRGISEGAAGRKGFVRKRASVI